MPINTGRFSRNRRQILNGGPAPEPLLNAERTDQILLHRHRIAHLVAHHVPFTVALAIRTLSGSRQHWLPQRWLSWAWVPSPCRLESQPEDSTSSLEPRGQGIGPVFSETRALDDRVTLANRTGFGRATLQIYIAYNNYYVNAHPAGKQDSQYVDR